MPVSNIKNIKKYIDSFIFLMIPVLCFYLLESYIQFPVGSMAKKIQLFNIIFYELAAVILLFLFGKAKYALRILITFTGIYGLANYYVTTFRSKPILPTDFLSIKTAATVAGNFSYRLGVKQISIVLLFVFLFIVSGKCKLELPKKLIIRVGGIIVTIAIFLGMNSLIYSEAFVKNMEMYKRLFYPLEMTTWNGTYVTFSMFMEYISVEPPKDYDKEEMEKLLAEYDTGETISNEREMPNIIVVMNESFSDLGIFGDLKTNKEVMPFVRSVLNGEVENTQSGYLDVSVRGGNTANSEFEFLTGNTMAFLPQGSVAYQQYIGEREDSMVSLLNDYGYQTVAMHPYGRKGWDRERVYEAFGFGTFLSEENYVNNARVRDYVSDMSNTKEIIRVYEEKNENQPLFVFNITMQNHGGWKEDYDNFTVDVNAEGDSQKELSRFLSLIRLSDESIEELISYFSNVEEETYILFFGDHQPGGIDNFIMEVTGRTNEILTEEEQQNQYKVPFFIWCNQDIEEKTNMELSLNYLGPLLLNVADIPKSSYYNYLESIQSKVPIITAMWSEGDDKTIAEYEKMQYYVLFDK